MLGLFVPLTAAFAQPATMTVDVMVTDKAGQPVAGLTQQDFTLLDNNRPLSIRGFRAVAPAAGAPAEVILLLDEINMPFTLGAWARTEIQKYCERSGAKFAHPTTLVLLNDKGITIPKAGVTDPAVLATALKDAPVALRVTNQAQGIYGAGEQTQMSVEAVQRLAQYAAPQPGRKLVIWISPGWPLLTGPGVDMEARQREATFAMVVKVSAALRDAGVTLYAVDPVAGSQRTVAAEQFYKPVKHPAQAENGDLGLQVLAVQSGGRVFRADHDVAGEIAHAAAEADNYYQLTFDRQSADGPNEFHSLTVKVSQPKLTVRTRSGYYAQPEHTAK